MSIKEALNRPSITEGSRVISDIEMTNILLVEQFQKGVKLLVEAGVPTMLDELAEIIRQEFPDVRTRDVNMGKSTKLSSPMGLDDRFQYWSYGTVSATVGWDYREKPIVVTQDIQLPGRPIRKGYRGICHYKSVGVEAIISTQDLIIKKWDPARPSNIMIPELFGKPPGGKNVIEDAIVEAYRNPTPRSN